MGLSEVVRENPPIRNLLGIRRKRRLEFVLSKMQFHPGCKVLDVGCGPDGRSLEVWLSGDLCITGIDILDPDEVYIDHPGFRYIKQDARDLGRFHDKEFDLTFSIGMMEHVCEREVLLRMAREIERVSRQYAIVVPWRYALIEPHFKLPFFQLYPPNIQRALIIAFNLCGGRVGSKIDPQWVHKTIQWLPTREWESIWQGSRSYVLPFWDCIVLIKTIYG